MLGEPDLARVFPVPLCTLDALLIPRTSCWEALGDTYNVVFVDESGLVTPPNDGRILLGITRKCVAALAQELGIGYREAVIPYATIGQYSECFMTTSLRFLMPVRQIDETPFSVGRGTQTVRLQAAFQALFQSETGHWLPQLGVHADPVPSTHDG